MPPTDVTITMPGRLQGYFADSALYVEHLVGIPVGKLIWEKSVLLSDSGKEDYNTITYYW